MLLEISLMMFIHFHIMATVYVVWMHRGFQHHLFEFHPVINNICRLLMWTIGWGSHPSWMKVAAGTHRHHHSHPDCDQDPHSPHIIPFLGLYYSDSYNPFYKHTSNEDLMKLAPDIPLFDDWMQHNFYKRFTGIPFKLFGEMFEFPVGALVFGLFYAFFFGWIGFIVGFCWMFVLRVAVLGVAVSMSHLWGYKHPERNNVDPNDKSVNMIPLGILLAGGELHSNHHVNTMAINDRIRWFEFDLGYYYIKILEFFGLVKIRYDIVVQHSSLRK